MFWRRAIAILVAVVTVLLLAAWILYQARDHLQPEEVVLVADGSRGRHLRRMRFVQPRYLQPAQVPWVRFAESDDSNTPLVDRPLAIHPLRLRPALVPRIPVRHDPASPTPVMLRPAVLPWQRDMSALRRVRLYPAEVPRILARRDWNRPEPAKVEPAIVPWQRNASQPHPAGLDAARIPSQLESAKPK